MEQALAKQDFLAPSGYSVADIALFGYTHCAEEGGLALAPYPAVRAWLARVQSQAGFVPMPPIDAANAALIAHSRAQMA
jgi:glutathione S-transferase